MPSPPLNPFVTVTSDANVQTDQDHRSSGDFSTEGAPSGTSRIQFVVTGNSNYREISFNVMRDKSWGDDPTVWSGVKNNTIVDYESSRTYYIADPTGAGGDSFIVEVWVAS